MVVLLKAIQVILALSVLIFVHELGHFTFARIFGIRVEKFYLFFDIGGKALLRFRKGDTEYGIGWLPLGGYCKISGMIDESLDTEQLKHDPKPWEFRTHPAWQRLLVMAGGVLYNFLFAILAYALILGIWGSGYVPNEGSRIYVNELSSELGFRTGDHIIAFDDYTPEDFSMLQADLVRREAHTATVLRGADTVSLYIDQSMLPQMLNTPGMFDLAVPFVVDTVMADSNNIGADLRKGDVLVAINGQAVPYVQDSRPLLLEHAGDTVSADLMRDTTLICGVPLQVDSAGHIGVYLQYPNFSTKQYTALEAIPAGFNMAVSTVGGYIQDLKLVFTPRTQAYKSVGSFISIGQAFPDSWNWYRFLNLLALLSIMLGVMNLLPIPGLDGGHILFLLVEIITRRKPSDRFLMAAQLVGMALLIMLMFLAFGNDISRLFH